MPTRASQIQCHSPLGSPVYPIQMLTLLDLTIHSVLATTIDKLSL